MVFLRDVDRQEDEERRARHAGRDGHHGCPIDGEVLVLGIDDGGDHQGDRANGLDNSERCGHERHGVHGHAGTQEQEAEHPAGVSKQAQEAVGAQGQAARVGLDGAPLALRTKGQAKRTKQRKPNCQPYHQAVPSSWCACILPFRRMAQK